MQMAVDVTCEAAGPWGLVGAIEDTMAAQVPQPDGRSVACGVPTMRM